MAFNTNPGKQQFSASGGQTAFNFNFAIFADTDLRVYLTPAGNTADDTADLLTLSTHYTVSINGTLGGTVTLLSGATLNDTVTIVRSLPMDRSTDYVTNGDLYADTLDLDQDYQTYLLVDQFVQLQRAVIVPESLAGVDLKIPTPLADSYLRWNATADALENDTTIPDAVVTSTTNAATATAQAGIATTKAGESSASATEAQLMAWEAEAERLTADSYATEAEDVPVNIITSNGDGTFTYTPTSPAEYSALHYRNKALLAASGDAVNISFDNTASGMTSTNVQDALDEIEGFAVKNTGDESIAGIKTFVSSPIVPTPSAGDDSTKVATTAFVASAPSVKGIFYTTYEEADGTAGQNLASGNRYPFNTIRANTITGASMTTGDITLPAGKYIFDCSISTETTGSTLLYLTINDVTQYHSKHTVDSTYAGRYPIQFNGYFELTSTQSVKLMYNRTATGTLGVLSGSTGRTEVYGELRITKVG